MSSLQLRRDGDRVILSIVLDENDLQRIREGLRALDGQAPKPPAPYKPLTPPPGKQGSLPPAVREELAKRGLLKTEPQNRSLEGGEAGSSSRVAEPPPEPGPQAKTGRVSFPLDEIPS